MVVCCAQLIWGFSEKCTSAGSNLGVQTSTYVIGLINNSIMFSFKEVSTDFWKSLCFLVFMSSGLIHLLMYCNVQLWLRWNFKRQYSKCWICLPFWKLFAFLHTQLTDFCCQVHNLSKTLQCALHKLSTWLYLWLQWSDLNVLWEERQRAFRYRMEGRPCCCCTVFWIFTSIIDVNPFVQAQINLFSLKKEQELKMK